MATVDEGSDTLWTLAMAEAQQAQDEAEACWQVALFEARLVGKFDVVQQASPWSRTRALAMTRAENESRGRPVRWGHR